jgi:trk system potassium uptake protein TrkA
MRFAFIGAGEVTVRTVETLIEDGHEVVVIEQDKERIDELSEFLDCSFLQGDGSDPKRLREVDPEHTDMLLCLSSSDQANIISSLVGRSLGFSRIVTSIQNPAYEDICAELGLEDVIIPSRTISRFLADMSQGLDVMELSTYMKNGLRFYSFTADKKTVGTIEELDLPEEAKVVCIYRGSEYLFTTPETSIKKDDEIVMLAHRDTLPELRERWEPRQGGEEPEVDEEDDGDGESEE